MGDKLRIPGPQGAAMPVLFVGHGSPMNAIDDNRWARAWHAMGESLPLPRAILAISAHWYTAGTFVLDSPEPTTIHDFGGFPRALFEVQYPAPGAPSIARRIRAVLGEERATLSSEWGFDHGTWSVLSRLFPQADVPVLQLSVDARLSPERTIALAHDLREEGVLIVGSGNITHNLGEAMRRGSGGAGDDDAPEWSRAFDANVVAALGDRDAGALAKLWPGTTGLQAHPTPDHWLPLLYTFGATDDDDVVTYPVAGFEYGLSMRACLFGRTAS